MLCWLATWMKKKRCLRVSSIVYPETVTKMYHIQTGDCSAETSKNMVFLFVILQVISTVTIAGSCKYVFYWQYCVVVSYTLIKCSLLIQWMLVCDMLCNGLSIRLPSGFTNGCSIDLVLQYFLHSSFLWLLQFSVACFSLSVLVAISYVCMWNVALIALCIMF